MYLHPKMVKGGYEGGVRFCEGRFSLAVELVLKLSDSEGRVSL